MTNKVQGTKIQDKKKTTVLSTSQLQPQESSNKQELLEFVQQEFVAQSSTLSIVTRTIAGVILGTIWAICYKENEAKIPNIWLAISLILSLTFFVIELLHYIVDAFFYHNKSDQIVNSCGNIDYKKEYDKIQGHSKYSFWFLMTKSFIVLVLSGIFIWGVISLYPSASTETGNSTTTTTTQQKNNKITK